MLRSIMSLGAASIWMIVGRTSGLAWTILLIFTTGIEDYGRYATAYAAAAILSAPVENIFVVRCVRVTEAEYRSERSLRALIGVALTAAGLAFYASAFVIGFALLIAGLEMIFNAYKSVALRAGEPGKIMRVDAIRQVASIGAAAAYLFIQQDTASLETACLWYLAPYIAIIALTARMCINVRPSIPRQWKEHGLLVLDALVLSVYLQGDILLLGILASDDIVGVYSVASQLALAASTIGQLYGQQFVASMRDQQENSAAGPPHRVTLGIGLVLFLGSAFVAIMLINFTSYQEIGWTLLLISPFAGLRAITNTWVTVLYLRGLDGPRILWSAIALGVRYMLLIILVSSNPGAAAFIASACAVIGEVILGFAFARLMTFRQNRAV